MTERDLQALDLLDSIDRHATPAQLETAIEALNDCCSDEPPDEEFVKLCESWHERYEALFEEVRSHGC